MQEQVVRGRWRAIKSKGKVGTGKWEMVYGETIKRLEAREREGKGTGERLRRNR